MAIHELASLRFHRRLGRRRLDTTGTGIPCPGPRLVCLCRPVHAHDDRDEHRQADGGAQQEAGQQSLESEAGLEPERDADRQRHHVEATDDGVHAQQRARRAPHDAAADVEREVDHLQHGHDLHGPAHAVPHLRAAGVYAGPRPARRQHEQAAGEARRQAARDGHPCGAARQGGVPGAQLVGDAHRRADGQRQHGGEQQVVEVEGDGDDGHHAAGVGEAAREEHQDLVGPPLEAGVEAAGDGETEERRRRGGRCWCWCWWLGRRPPPELVGEHVGGEHEREGEVAEPDCRGHSPDAHPGGERDGERDVERQRQRGGEQRGQRHLLRAEVGLERVEHGGDGEVREEAEHVGPGRVGDVGLLAEAQQDGVDARPEERDGDGGGEEHERGPEQRPAQEGDVPRAVRLAADGLHGAAEAGEDGEAGDVGEAVAERAGGQLEVAEAAQEGGGDGLLGEPGEVHADERERDAALRAHLGRNSGEAMRLMLGWRWCRHGRWMTKQSRCA